MSSRRDMSFWSHSACLVLQLNNCLIMGLSRPKDLLPKQLGILSYSLVNWGEIIQNEVLLDVGDQFHQRLACSHYIGRSHVHLVGVLLTLSEPGQLGVVLTFGHLDDLWKQNLRLESEWNALVCYLQSSPTCSLRRPLVACGRTSIGLLCSEAACDWSCLSSSKVVCTGGKLLSISSLLMHLTAMVFISNDLTHC